MRGWFFEISVFLGSFVVEEVGVCFGWFCLILVVFVALGFWSVNEMYFSLIWGFFECRLDYVRRRMGLGWSMI